MCRRHFDPKIIQTASAEMINHHDWEETTNILIMPGGRATPYFEDLYLHGNQKIKNFVMKGGCYFGLCAGGYYGASRIIFEKDHRHEIITENALGLYKGIAEGPAYECGVFEYNSEAGAKVIEIMTHDNIVLPVYFNGGCWFEDIGANINIKILARYTNFHNKPAIISFSYGKGSVILSGVHFEYLLQDGYKEQRDVFAWSLFSTGRRAGCFDKN